MSTAVVVNFIVLVWIVFVGNVCKFFFCVLSAVEWNPSKVFGLEINMAYFNESEKVPSGCVSWR